jgi:hypothetical protein
MLKLSPDDFLCVVANAKYNRCVTAFFKLRAGHGEAYIGF